MDFSYSPEQQGLRELATRLLGEHAGDDARRAFARSGRTWDEGLWGKLADAGLLAIAIDDAQGGAGLGLTELGLLLEAHGRSLASVPLFAALVLGALPLQRFGTGEQRALLSQVGRGELILSAALTETGEPPEAPRARAVTHGDGWRLHGLKDCVPYGAQARHLVVAAQTDTRGPGLFLVATDAPGVSVTAETSTSGEPQAQVRFQDTPLPPGAALTGDGQALPWLLSRARVLLAAWQLGVIAEALRRASAYVTERRQFGRPVGSFQAVQHRLADAFIDVEALRSAYLRAVWALDAGREVPEEVLAAHYWMAEAGHRVTHAVQHVHGGLGADLEYPVHAYFLRARQNELCLGGASATLAGLGAALARGSVPFTALGDGA
ncbi:MAG: acyl-CoA dehydrogenase family protein [Proteobacteria bacterium]|nr:acyl-CoA dehydrogenase family protein [Pseudomonadota bacterium]